MEKALFIKEWLKTRRIFWLCLIFAVAIAVYTFFILNRIAVAKGVDHIYLIMILKDQIFINDILEFFPLAVGLAIGIAQMVPEMSQKRLKLTLHLPVSMYKSIGYMLITAYIELLIIFLIQAVMIALIFSHFVAPELVERSMLTMIPWYAAGFVAYSFSAAICLEGTTFRRIIIALIGFAFLRWHFFNLPLEAYNPAIWFMILLIILLPLLSFNSVFRFKEGRQD